MFQGLNVGWNDLSDEDDQCLHLEYANLWQKCDHKCVPVESKAHSIGMLEEIQYKNDAKSKIQISFSATEQNISQTAGHNGFEDICKVIIIPIGTGGVI